MFIISINPALSIPPKMIPYANFSAFIIGVNFE